MARNQKIPSTSSDFTPRLNKTSRGRCFAFFLVIRCWAALIKICLWVILLSWIWKKKNNIAFTYRWAFTHSLLWIVHQENSDESWPIGSLNLNAPALISYLLGEEISRFSNASRKLFRAIHPCISQASRRRVGERCSKGLCRLGRRTGTVNSHCQRRHARRRYEPISLRGGLLSAWLFPSRSAVLYSREIDCALFWHLFVLVLSRSMLFKDSCNVISHVQSFSRFLPSLLRLSKVPILPLYIPQKPNFQNRRLSIWPATMKMIPKK